jgi:hypothetical protein
LLLDLGLYLLPVLYLHLVHKQLTLQLLLIQHQPLVVLGDKNMIQE